MDIALQFAAIHLADEAARNVNHPKHNAGHTLLNAFSEEYRGKTNLDPLRNTEVADAARELLKGN